MRDLGLLASAAPPPSRRTPLRTGRLPRAPLEAGALLDSIVRIHALVVGNTRLPGCLATVMFLGLNAIHLDAPDDAASDLVVGLALGPHPCR